MKLAHWTCAAATAAALLTLNVAQAAAPISPVRLSQIGFERFGPKKAMVPNPSTVAIEWTLVDDQGAVRARGKTRVVGDDLSSGEHLHAVDFSDFNHGGPGFRLSVGTASSRPFPIADAIRGRLKYDALNYFYQNRAAVPIEARFAGGAKWSRPAGHATETASCVAGADGKGNVWPGCPYRLDVKGGWYDAGDQGKYVVNGGISVWTLLNYYERQRLSGKASPFADKAALPEHANGVDDLLDEARWELEFLLRMQVPEGTRFQLPVGIKRSAANMTFTDVDASGMAHHKVADEKWTPLPTPPHLDKEKRILFPPSTAATLNLAANAAQCARIWRTIDPAFSARCLAAAERAWHAALRNPEVWAVADFTGSGGYGDSELSDEFYWAAAELFLTTGGVDYEKALRGSPHFSARRTADFSWPSVATLGTISLALVKGKLAFNKVAALRSSLIAAADASLSDGDRVGYDIPYAPAGYPWGSNSSILNRAIVLALAHDFTGERRYRDGVVDAMDYLLGRNPLDQSYIAGYGARPMRNPHHRFWTNQLDPTLPIAPPGTLSGGPNSTSMGDPVATPMKGKCAPQTCWSDDARSYTMNEVAINWNAPLVWVAAFLDEPKPEPR